MARKLSDYEGGVLVSGGIEPAGEFYVAEAGYILAENGKDLATKLSEIDAIIGGDGSEESLPSQINSINDKLNNYYTKTQLDGSTGKIDKSSIITDLNVEATDQQVPSAKAVNTAIGQLNQAVNNDFYTKEEIDLKLYVAITVTSTSLSKSTFEQGDPNNNVTFTWKSSINAVSAKITYNGTTVETIENGETKNTGTYPLVIDTSTVGSNGTKSISASVTVKDSRDSQATKSASATICNPVYLGGAIKYNGDINALINSFSSGAKKLQTSKAASGTITVAPNMVLTYAVPVGYGTPTSIKVNGSPSTFDNPANNAEYTNTFNSTVRYNVYQNKEAVNEQTTYEVEIK